MGALSFSIYWLRATKRSLQKQMSVSQKSKLQFHAVYYSYLFYNWTFNPVVKCSGFESADTALKCIEVKRIPCKIDSKFLLYFPPWSEQKHVFLSFFFFSQKMSWTEMYRHTALVPFEYDRVLMPKPPHACLFRPRWTKMPIRDMRRIKSIIFFSRSWPGFKFQAVCASLSCPVPLFFLFSFTLTHMHVHDPGSHWCVCVCASVLGTVAYYGKCI